MEDSYLSLVKEVKLSKDLRTCIETLLRIFRNIVEHPEESKYRTLRTGNKSFYEKVWQFDASKRMMKDSGWILEGDNVVLPPDQDLTVPLFFLIENRNVKPSAKEWVSETKHVIPNQEKEKERQLREEAFAKKEKEMVDLKKDMAERKDIVAGILADHRNDPEKRKVPVGGSSKHYDQPTPGTSHAASTPRWVSSTNVLGGSRGAANSTFPANGAHGTAHRRAPAFPHPSPHSEPQLHQQPSGNNPPSFGAGRHTAASVGASNYPPSSGAGGSHYPPFGAGRHTDGVVGNQFGSRPTAGTGRPCFERADEAPLRLGRGAVALRPEDYDDEHY